MPDTMTARECADSLGVSLDWFNRRRAALIARGMPASATPFGRYRPDRATWQAWRKRRDVPTLAPANDPAPVPEPRSDQAWADYLAKAYP